MRRFCACLKQTCANLRLSEADMRRICAHVCTWGGVVLFLAGNTSMIVCARNFAHVCFKHAQIPRMSVSDMREICACLDAGLMPY